MVIVHCSIHGYHYTKSRAYIMNWEEGMHHAYIVWYGKIQTGRQDMPNLDLVDCTRQVNVYNGGKNVAAQAFVYRACVVALIPWKLLFICSSVFEFCCVCAMHALFPVYKTLLK